MNQRVVPDNLLGRRMAPTKLIPHPTLSVVAPGPPTVLRSSTSLGWNGFLVERHVSIPGVRVGKFVDRPVLVMLCSAFSHGEHRAITGEFLPYRKTHGALTVVPTGPVPELRLLARSELAYCAFEPWYLRRISEELDGPLPPPIEFRSNNRDPQIQDIFNLLLTELDTRAVNEPLYVESLAHAFAVRFLKLGTGASRTQRPVTFFSTPTRLARIKEVIDAGLHGRLTLEALANESGYSRSHFLRWFQMETGMTPHEFVLEQRLERATRLLAAKLNPLTDIADQCGFSSQSHMTAAFRRKFGLPPGAYRKQMHY
jgi:AraC family transcriptional regulator